MATLPLDTPLAEEGITQKQIAEQLGVSRQLVSLALRGQGRMAENTRQQILEIAQKGGYNQYSNREARTMASKRYGKRAATGVLAVLFAPTFDDQPLFNIPFFMPFFEGLESEAAERDIELALCPLRASQVPRLVRERQVDGTICLLTPYETVQQLEQLNVPMINIQHKVAHLPSLIIDEPAGTALTTQHLIDLGHQQIAYLGVANPLKTGEQAENQTEGQRLRGYMETLAKNGRTPTDSLIESSLREPAIQDGIWGMEQLIQRFAPTPKTRANSQNTHLPFSGLVCYNDALAIGAIKLLQERGWLVPEDISVTGFDDVSLQHNFSPAITSIRFPRQKMARRAVQWLCELEGDPKEWSDWRETFPVELVVRDSTRSLTTQF